MKRIDAFRQPHFRRVRGDHAVEFVDLARVPRQSNPWAHSGLTAPWGRHFVQGAETRCNGGRSWTAVSSTSTSSTRMKPE
jgi:hypothetical protein